MSYPEFIERFDNRSHVEWINDEVVEMAPIGEDHDRLNTFLIRLMGDFLEANPIGELRHDPQAQDKLALLDQLQAWGEQLAASVASL